MPTPKKQFQRLSVTTVPEIHSNGSDLVSCKKWLEAHNGTLPTSCTLLELVLSVNDYTTSDVETVAVVTYLINSGRVRLHGTFAGAKITFPPTHAKSSCNDE
jgi:hypothetical protein